MTNQPICPCDQVTHPAVITNPAGRDTIAYRTGDYASFRRALLLALQDENGTSEQELTLWNPTARSDLALQMMEWWAYLADVLTFYNERIANESYLHTAALPENVRRIIRTLGYRPQPGIGATGVVAGLISSQTGIKLPQGFPIQSKPGPGKQPQIFELDAETPLKFPDRVEADLPPNPLLLSGKSVLLKGTVTGVKEGDRLLLLEKGWRGNTGNYAVVTVAQVQPEKDTRGKANTRIAFVTPPDLPDGALAANYRLLRSKQFTHLWQYASKEAVITNQQAHLEAIARSISVGDPVLFEYWGDIKCLDFDPQSKKILNTSEIVQQVIADPLQQAPSKLMIASTAAKFQTRKTTPSIAETQKGDAKAGKQFWWKDPAYYRIPSIETLVRERMTSQLASVTSSTEKLWSINAANSAASSLPMVEVERLKIAIPIPHTLLTLQVPPKSVSLALFNPVRQDVQVRYDFLEIGVLMGTPTQTVSGTKADSGKVQLTLLAVNPDHFPAGSHQVLLEDAKGWGFAASGSVSADGRSIQLTITASSQELSILTPPLQVLFNPLSVSRGQTVVSEILGGGNASLSGQTFVLKNSPLTYLPSGTSFASGSYRSTLRVWVNWVEWREVPSFYGQPANAHVFVTREDEDQKTWVQFGDGINGARLPSGINNVVASYRFGSGAEAPDRGTLTVIVQPYPSLKALRNPVSVGGGSEPKRPEQIKRDAPRSVLTLGRAVSVDDYEAIAARASGVIRARAYWSWDTQYHRSLVKIYVGDDDKAVENARLALAGQGDPTVPVVVERAIARPIKLVLALRLDATFNPTDIDQSVIPAVQKALLDADTGLFGANVLQIGQSIYQSQIYAICLAVPGVLAVHGLQFFTDDLPLRNRFDPGEGKFFQLQAQNLVITKEGG